MPQIINGTKFVSADAPAMEPASDQEFDEWFEGMLQGEQEHIDASIAGGAAFVLSQLGGVHTVSCPRSGFFASRREAWERLLPGATREPLRQQVAHGSPPPMPQLLTAAEVAAMTRKYRRCAICAPDVPEYVKRDSGARTLDQVRKQLRVSIEKYGAKPAAAVLAVLDLHHPVDRVCVGCREDYPCPTVSVVADALKVPA